MSVSFTTEFLADQPHRLTCSCGNFWGRTFDSYYEAYQQKSFYKSTCRDQLCNAYPMQVESVDEAPDVNISNANAVEILDALDYRQGEDFSDRCTGSMTAEEFAERLLFARASSVGDPGVPATRDGNIINFGRRPGYVDEVLQMLQDVADYAASNNLMVQWA